MELVTKGCVMQMRAMPTKSESNHEVVVQVLSVKILDVHNPPRVKVVVCDGTDSLSCMFTHTSLHDFQNNTVRPGTIIKLTKFLINEIKTAR
jgi:hypothetical protein